MVESLRKYGLFRGVLHGLRRLSRCHPWHPGGYDPP
jgi:putative component of membrane protein insertase Oxa1/YidC/SpoIIIJ protein YidD